MSPFCPSPFRPLIASAAGRPIRSNKRATRLTPRRLFAAQTQSGDGVAGAAATAAPPTTRRLRNYAGITPTFPPEPSDHYTGRMLQAAHETVGLLEAKTHLSAILERVRATGQPVVVTRRGEPIAEITPVKDREPKKMTREEAFAVVREMRGTFAPITAEEIHADIRDGRH